MVELRQIITRVCTLELDAWLYKPLGKGEEPEHIHGRTGGVVVLSDLLYGIIADVIGDVRWR